MKPTIRFMLEAIKVMVLFIGCTILFYMTISWIHEEYQNYRRYDVPNGSFQEVTSQNQEEKEAELVSRLIFFYENGE